MNAQKEGDDNQIIIGQNSSKIFWILMFIGLLVYIILFFSSGNGSFFGLLGMIIGGLVISKFVAHIFSVISKEKSKRRQKITWAIVFLIVSATTILNTLVNVDRGSTNTSSGNSGQRTFIAPIQQTHLPQVAISNPDYLENPSAYLVDYENKMSSTIPEDRPLWVEDVSDPAILRVSYEIERASTKIIAIQDLKIPGVQPLPLGDCSFYGSIDFLKKNLLHKKVYLVSSESSSAIISPPGQNGSVSAQLEVLLSESGKQTIGKELLVQLPESNQMQDITMLVISSGYGRADVDFYTRENSHVHPNPMGLQDQEEVASLAKKGLWGTCK